MCAQGWASLSFNEKSPYGSVAQLAERVPVKHDVVGSSPTGTAIRGCNSAGRVTAL